MANEIRLRSNNMSGTITDNPLTNVATTINSAAFVSLPTVDATNHLILILDPLGVTGTPEIVRVTAHTAASSVVTVTRGAEGSAARACILGTTWFHGPVVSDFRPLLATSGARPAVPYTGEKILETDTLRNMVYTGTVWQQDGLYWDPPACRVFHNASVSIANAVSTTLGTTAGTTTVFNSERYDTDNMHNPGVNPGRITFNTAGIYQVGTDLSMAQGTYTLCEAFIRLNGTQFIAALNVGFSQDGNDNTYLNICAPYKFAVNDYIEVVVFQVSAAARNINAASGASAVFDFHATWIGRGN